VASPYKKPVDCGSKPPQASHPPSAALGRDFFELRNVDRVISVNRIHEETPFELNLALVIERYLGIASYGAACAASSKHGGFGSLLISGRVKPAHHVGEEQMAVSTLWCIGLSLQCRKFGLSRHSPEPQT